jgi:DNA-binding CsgD family transcriptional regulator
MDRARENEVVDAFYDAALGHQSWEQAGHQLRQLLAGKTLMLSTHDSVHSTADVVLTLGMAQEQVQEYGHFAAHDVWALGALKRRIVGKALTGEQVVAESTLLRSYIYNEYLRPRVDARYMVGSILPLRDGSHAVVGVHRPHDTRDFTAEDAERMNLFLPHLQRALEVRRRLQVDARRMDSKSVALDHLSVGIITIDASGRLLHANAAGEAILERGDGLLRTPGGLMAANRDDDRRLQALLAELRQPSPERRSAGGHLRVRRPSGRHAFAVMLVPAGSGKPGVRRTSRDVIAFVSDPSERIGADLSVLASLFGFGPGEARLVLALTTGKSLPEISLQFGLSYNTVRKQLARAMAKTETRSQAELVLLVARAVGGVVWPTAALDEKRPGNARPFLKSRAGGRPTG